VVAKADFPNRMDWEAATKACEDLGSGWRLPTKDELEMMDNQLHQENKGNFKDEGYWSSTENEVDGAWAVIFGGLGDCKVEKGGDFQVRAVRAF